MLEFLDLYLMLEFLDLCIYLNMYEYYNFTWYLLHLKLRDTFISQ